MPVVNRWFDTATSTGVDPVIHWRTPDGERREFSSPDKTVVLAVEAETDLNPSGQGGINRVVFSVYVNGGAETRYPVTGRTLVYPNYDTNGGRQSYSPNHGPAPFWGFQKVLDLSTLAGGTITVVAHAYAESGDVADTDTLTIYNDTDGTDRRPNSSVIYVSSSGSPSGAGTAGDPLDSIQSALSGEMGGATIRVLDGLVGCGGDTGADTWYTTGAHKVTVQMVGTDKTWQRTSPPSYTSPDDGIYGAGMSGSGKAHIEFVDFEFVGPGITLYADGTADIKVTDRHCESHSSYWDALLDKPHVDYATDGGGQPIGFDGPGTGTLSRYSWGHYRYGVSYGLSGYTSVYDYKCEFFLGVGLRVSSDETDAPVATCLTIGKSRYKNGEVDGYVNTTEAFSETLGANCTISVPTAGQMKIQADNATPVDFATPAETLVGNARWQLRVTGATTSANNGDFDVLETGVNGSGYPYVILDNASAVGETGGASMHLETVQVSSGTVYSTLIHPDVLKIENDLDGAMFAHIRAYDCRNTRAYVSSGHNLTRTVFKNCTDGSETSGSDTCQSDFTGSDLIDCLLLSMTFASDAVDFDAATTYTRTNAVDCVFSDTPSNFDLIPFVHSCHFVSGTTYGIGATSGSWFLDDPAADPWDFSPDTGNVGTGGCLVVVPDEFGWS